MFAALTLENLIVPIIAISFTSVIGLMTWMVRELSRISTTLSVTDERSQNIVRRIENLEDEQRHIVRILD
jgi:type II secretory pathway component PulJ